MNRAQRRAAQRDTRRQIRHAQREAHRDERSAIQVVIDAMRASNLSEVPEKDNASQQT